MRPRNKHRASARWWGLPSLAALTLLARTSGWGENPVPERWPRERFAGLAQSSPFAVASAVAAPKVENSFAVNWFVSGLARLNGQDFVSVKSRDQGTQFTLHGRQSSYQGITLVAVDWSPVAGESVVTLTNGRETASLRFNEAEVRRALADSTGPAGSNAVAVEDPAKLTVMRKRVAPIKAPR